MENTNPTTAPTRPRSISPAGQAALAARRKLQRARGLWRLCAAIEFACARLGTTATVADVLKAAGMSRRSFYEFFGSLEHAIECMHRTQLLALSQSTLAGPCASWVLLSRNPSRDIGMEASAAFEVARNVMENGAPREVPDNEVLLTWVEVFDRALTPQD